MVLLRTPFPGNRLYSTFVRVFFSDRLFCKIYYRLCQVREFLAIGQYWMKLWKKLGALFSVFAPPFVLDVDGVCNSQVAMLIFTLEV